MTKDGGGAALRHVRTLYTLGAVGGLTDGQLLERFATRDGEAAELAFAALVERHGPMVLRVCRSVLRDAHDAQDAFQATFLVLVRRAGSIRKRDSLASWLHGVAYRTASCGPLGRGPAEAARAEGGRDRRRASRERGQVGTTPGPVLHEELERLPGRYREADRALRPGGPDPRAGGAAARVARSGRSRAGWRGGGRSCVSS